MRSPRSSAGSFTTETGLEAARLGAGAAERVPRGHSLVLAAPSKPMWPGARAAARSLGARGPRLPG